MFTKYVIDEFESVKSLVANLQ
ncbi:hypothetical protein AFERRI_560067 [Acidithiobacillus ferrivorans]|uniref:Uncharacterized protein n=1 Tax=Acidithiobacillus ferrivorans TaxID=160808 RepID=A0A060UXV2_9PROT|nr:hypothetical protein AFERRI_560067 [Acidithiobacillus ferrivorans]